MWHAFPVCPRPSRTEGAPSPGRRAVLGGMAAAAALASVPWPLRAESSVPRDLIPRDLRTGGDRAPWNRPVAGLPPARDGDELVRLLWDHASDRPGNFNLNLTEGFAVYHADDADGPYRIRLAWGGPLDGQFVPWNPRWRIPPGEDRKVIVLDRATGREWNLYQADFADGRLRASNGSLVPGRYDTYTGTNPRSRGVGIQYSAMLVRPFEIEQGVIRHALAMTIDNTDGRRFVAPAVKLEHPGTRRGIPEGTRFAITAGDAAIESWIRGLPEEIRLLCAPGARTIARALRDYGWFITDTGGSGSLEFEANASAEDRWRKLGFNRVEARNGKVYPRDLLDGLLSPDNIVAFAPSDAYPPSP
ncbi:hypothetical protein [Azospirillum sp. sgz302134]